MTHCSSIGLVVLAAGLGRRFGGEKQLAPIGSTGRPLMHFSAMDAWRAGVRKLVLVVNEAVAALVKSEFLPLLPGDMEVSLVLQRPDDVPPGFPARRREKPWGTGHALWCARDAVSDEFIVINADDYYGYGSMERLVSHFGARRNWAMIGFPLAGTLSAAGAVSRGLCEVRDDYLTGIRECHGIALEDGAIRGEVDGRAIVLQGDMPVSMNIWGFSRDFFDCLERGLARFFSRGEAADEAEFYLPEQVMAAIAAGEGRVRVYPASDPWHGITYKDDLALLGDVFNANG